MQPLAWIAQLDAAQRGDHREQPWKQTVGDKVADRNPVAYSKKEDTDLLGYGENDSKNGRADSPDSGDETTHCGGGSGTFSG